MKGSPLENLSIKSPHYVSFLPTKRESPDHRPSDNSFHSNIFLNTNQSTRASNYANSFKFDFQRNRSPQPTIDQSIKYTLPSSYKKEPTVIDMMLGGTKLRSPQKILSEKQLSTMGSNGNEEKYMDSHQSPKNNFNNLEEFQPKNKLNSEMFDTIMRHIDKKFTILENKLKITEETLASQQSERLNDKINFEKKEKERESVFLQERQKDIEKLNEELEKKERKINDISLKVSGIENKVQLLEEKINRFQNQNEMKINNISSEIQTSLNKFLKSGKEMNSKIDLIYESPQIVFQKIVDDQEKMKRNNEDSMLFNQKINILSEDFREKVSDLNSNMEGLGQIVKKNNCDIGEQKFVVNKIEEDFIKLLNFYKDLNEEIIKLKSFQDEIFQLKAKQGELISYLSGLKAKKKKL